MFSHEFILVIFFSHTLSSELFLNTPVIKFPYKNRPDTSPQRPHVCTIVKNLNIINYQERCLPVNSYLQSFLVILYNAYITWAIFTHLSLSLPIRNVLSLTPKTSRTQLLESLSSYSKNVDVPWYHTCGHILSYLITKTISIRSRHWF